MTGTNTFPVLPLRDIVVFPHMIVPLFVGREKSVRALEEVTNGDGRILLAAQHDAGVDDPGPDDIFAVGTVGSILQLLLYQRFYQSIKLTRFSEHRLNGYLH